MNCGQNVLRNPTALQFNFLSGKTGELYNNRDYWLFLKYEANFK